MRRERRDEIDGAGAWLRSASGGSVCLKKEAGSEAFACLVVGWGSRGRCNGMDTARETGLTNGRGYQVPFESNVRNGRTSRGRAGWASKEERGRRVPTGV